MDLLSVVKCNAVLCFSTFLPRTLLPATPDTSGKSNEDAGFRWTHTTLYGKAR